MMALSEDYFFDQREITTDGIAILLSMMTHGVFWEGYSVYMCGSYPATREIILFGDLLSMMALSEDYFWITYKLPQMESQSCCL